MSLDAAWLAAHKQPLMIAGAAGVAGLALLKRKKGKPAAAGSSAVQGDGTLTTLGGIPYSAGGQAFAGAAYDSTASDLYGALQPQIEAIGQQLGDLKSQIGTPVPAPPAPAPVPGPAPVPAAAPTPAGPAPAGGQFYTVKPGDNLSKIAARYPSPSITWRSLYQLNRGVIGGNPNMIRPGQTLRIG